MAAAYFYLPFRPALDANGIVVPGAQLIFCLTGTLTPTPIYSDEALTVPLTNPVEANSAGVWPAIYLNDAVTYRVILKDADGATLNDVDPYLPNVIDGLTEDLQAIADQAVAAKTGAETAETNAETAQAAAEAAVGAVRQDLKFAIQPDAGIEEGAWYAEFFLPVATDYTLVRHWIYLGTGTANLYINVNDIGTAGPFAVGTTSDSDAVSFTVPAGSRVSFEFADLTGAPLAIAVTLEGLPA